MSSHVDGNALAGTLSEVFRTDMTTAVCCCDGCGETTTLASEMVYGTHGIVVRCRSCDDVLITLVETPDRVVLSFPGVSSMSVERGPDAQSEGEY
ncbi:hypothetical protein CLV49_2877 [Labedella gwakjiensis]|uniref:Uncharacterized protein n=1 Tax=Labedella gwakjiensis TaxID=390269 RepID=A0A2P8GZ46_9MICO|nr:DUF6510 family protein [Labedella gwakjiensis]PSL39243.1 hypothetical protein CLV49_2877 [Labedella gwakjiensis]RUQ86333.1 hypothetical protein ELQ93_04865 [Labedella gwakjiensis]